jgi:protein TonB
MDSAASDNKSKYTALGLTILFHVLLFLLFLFHINVPDPPFAVVPGPEAVVDLGMGMAGFGNTDAGGSGKKDPDLATKSEPAKVTPVVKTNTAEDVITDKTGEVVDIKSSPKKKPKKQVVTEVVKPTEEKIVEEKASAELANALANIRSKKAHTGQGSGGGETGGTGNGTKQGAGNGTGTGHGNGEPGGGGTGGYDLTGRSLERRPQRMTDSGEEGTVVVEIIVDETGKVIKATPGKRGSTTTSATLYAKARQAAMQAKFNPKEGVKEQRGTYTFVFTLE